MPMALRLLRSRASATWLSRQAGRVERVGDVDDRQIADLAGQVDRLQRRDGRSISIGGVAVDVLSEVPEAGSVLRLL